MTTMFSVPATPISDEMAALQPAFEAFVSAAGLQKDYGYSFYRELPQDGYTVVLASLDRLSASLLFQFDLLVNQAFPAPDYQP